MQKTGEKTMNNIYLQYAGRCSEIGMKWYSLSARVPREEWMKISKYFEKFEEDEDEELCGWLTAQPEVVEKILGVREELTLEYRRREAEKRREEKKKKTLVLQAKIDDQKSLRMAEYPKTENKMKIEGEKIPKPLNPENPWGGEWWVPGEWVCWNKVRRITGRKQY